ncbi:MAG: hypothetical protein JWM22_1239 [Frankiales bacterium]|nr:hypothetical protein [Frankiales bacterium]
MRSSVLAMFLLVSSAARRTTGRVIAASREMSQDSVTLVPPSTGSSS